MYKFEPAIKGFSENVPDIFEQFEFDAHIGKLATAGLLHRVASKFVQADLHPAVNNKQMGSLFEELICKFAEHSNETVGARFMPREVIRLMVNLLFVEDDDILSKLRLVRPIFYLIEGLAECFRSLENIWESTTQKRHRHLHVEQL